MKGRETGTRSVCVHAVPSGVQPIMQERKEATWLSASGLDGKDALIRKGKCYTHKIDHKGCKGIRHQCERAQTVLPDGLDLEAVWQRGAGRGRSLL